jgi:hypothetical protein
VVSRALFSSARRKLELKLMFFKVLSKPSLTGARMVQGVVLSSKKLSRPVSNTGDPSKVSQVTDSRRQQQRIDGLVAIADVHA